MRYLASLLMYGEEVSLMFLYSKRDCEKETGVNRS